MPLHKLRRSGGSEAFSLTYLGTDASPASDNYTFSGVTFGDPSSSRIIIVNIGVNDIGDAITGVTIRGVTATQLLAPAGSGYRAYMYAAAVPAGATGDIVVTGTGSPYSRIAWYRMTGSRTGITPSNSGSTTVASGTISLACTVPTDGVGVVFIGDDIEGNHTPTNYTEDFDVKHAGAVADSATGGTFTTSATLTCQNTTDNTDDKVMLYASWGP